MSEAGRRVQLVRETENETAETGDATSGKEKLASKCGCQRKKKKREN